MTTTTETNVTQKTIDVTKPGPREVRTERIVHAKRERVWRAYTEPAQLAQWWGRGNKVVIEKFEPVKGGHWRFVEHGPDGVHGFEGRYREVTPVERIVQTFEWDGMPGYPSIDTVTFEDLGDRTRIVTSTLFFTEQERDGMLGAGMTDGMEQSYAALDRLLAS